MTLAAGIDVGNSTTEVVLARLTRDGIEVVGADRAPTRRAKGSPESLDGAAALVRRLERRHGVRVDAAVAAPLRPVETLTASLPEPREATGRVRVVTAGASTAGGRGVGVGRPFRLGDGLPGGEADGVPLVAVVPSAIGYREAVERGSRHWRRRAGWPRCCSRPTRPCSSATGSAATSPSSTRSDARLPRCWTPSSSPSR